MTLLAAVPRPASILHRWGIVTATDIVLAWLVAKLVFGKGHPAIDYLLLLAVADDALGMAIIAVFYPDPTHPVKPIFLLYVVAGMLVSYCLRAWYFRENSMSKKYVQSWIPYILLGGSLSWVGFIKAHLYPSMHIYIKNDTFL